MEYVNVIQTAIEATERHKIANHQQQSHLVCDYLNDTDSFRIFNAQPNETSVGTQKLCDTLRKRGFALLDLPPLVTTKIQYLEKQAYKTIHCIDESNKRRLSKIFRNCKEFRNYFTYAFLSGPGKETWRIRAINKNTKEAIHVPQLSELEQFFDLTYSVMVDLHQIGLDVLRVLSLGLYPSVEETYINSHSEPVLYCEDLSFGLSHINLLRYFDMSKQVPVNPHTDQYMVTILPLNSGNPSLEAWDFSQEQWISLEANAASQGKSPFSSAVILVGETLSKITNDYFVSSLHRVVAPCGSARFSCPFFLSARKNTMLDPTPYVGPHKPFGTNDNVKPIEVGNFLWECTLAQNENEKSIMERWKKSITKNTIN